MSADIIIVGAGIVGLSSAHELVGKGARVTVLDRGKPGMEASWAGGGILFPLLPWDYLDEVTSLAFLSMALYPEWTEALQHSSGVDPEYMKCGMTVLPGIRSMEKASSWCASHGVRFLEEPGGKFVLPDVAQVRNPRLIRALSRALENLGVTILQDCEAVSFERKNGNIVGVRTAQGDVHSGQDYVVCAGAWSGMLLGPDGPDIYPVKGQMLLFEAGGLLDTILFKDGIYLVPRKDGHILAGSTLEHAGFDKTVTSAHWLHEKAAEILPALGHLSPVKQWAGLRPGSPDNIPTICRHPAIGNLYINSGHFRYGVTMAPASAKLLSSLIFGETSLLDIDPYNCKK